MLLPRVLLSLSLVSLMALSSAPLAEQLPAGRTAPEAPAENGSTSEADAASDADASADSGRDRADSAVPYADIQALARVFEQIKRTYVEELDDRALLRDAMRGMLEGLDPHSAYLDEEAFQNLQEMTEGEFGGIGIEVGQEDGRLMVISPIDDTPASRAGLQPRDRIVEIDGEPTEGMSLEEAVTLMRGEPGTEIDLTLLREGSEAPIEVTLERANIRAESVSTRELAPGYGYLRISQFQNDTGEEAAEALETLASNSDLKGLVLDLRNNPGGLLEAAVDVTDLFLSEGLVVSTRGRLADASARFEARQETALPELPVVVLINGGSASAAEIVAGALQDHRRAVVLGTESFGKGSVQSVMPLGDDTAIKLTTALYYTPGGRSIQAEGIEPDVVVQRGRLELATDGREIRESSLRGHLENEGDTAREASLARSSVATEDYQLGEALNLLRGISVYSQGAERRNTPPTAEASAGAPSSNEAESAVEASDTSDTESNSE